MKKAWTMNLLEKRHDENSKNGRNCKCRKQVAMKNRWNWKSRKKNISHKNQKFSSIKWNLKGPSEKSEKHSPMNLIPWFSPAHLQLCSSVMHRRQFRRFWRLSETVSFRSFIHERSFIFAASFFEHNRRTRRKDKAVQNRRFKKKKPNFSKAVQNEKWVNHDTRHNRNDAKKEEINKSH